MRLGDLEIAEARRRLRGDGLHLATGMFVTCLRSDLKRPIDDFFQLYQDYDVDLSPGIDDFLVTLRRSRRPSHWRRPRTEALIEGQPLFDPMPLDFALPLLESTLNWCVGMNLGRHLLLHSAVVERRGVALILPGESGSGKSTLCAALVSRGWRLLSDEMAIIDLADGRVHANPRPISLKNEAIDVIRRLVPEAHFSRPFVGSAKGTIAFLRAPAEAVAEAGRSAVPKIIVWPRYGADTPARLDPVDRITGVRWLVDAAVNYEATGRPGFDALTGLIASCRRFALAYDDLTGALDGIAEACAPILGADRAA